MEDTARRVRELQAEAEATTQHVEQSKKERVRVSLQLRKQQRTLEVGSELGHGSLISPTLNLDSILSL